MANSIPTLQNDTRALRFLVAQRRLYGRAKWVMAVQVLSVAFLPLGLVLASRFWPEVKVGAATVGLIISILDVALLNVWKRSLQKRGAAVQELFDCHTFGLEWPDFKVEKPDPEDIESLSRGLDINHFKDWYPPSVGILSSHAAVAACQRSNCRWESQLRRHFRAALLSFAGSLILVMVSIALLQNLTMQDLILSLLAPILPTVLWAFREAGEQREAAERADRLKRFGDQLWEQILDKSLSSQDAQLKLRAFQDAILEYRQRSPMIFDWFYKLFRESFEKQLSFSAEQMVEAATKRGLTA
jgi:hypothetical protein